MEVRSTLSPTESWGSAGASWLGLSTRVLIENRDHRQGVALVVEHAAAA